MSTFSAYLITPPTGPREWDTVRERAKGKARDAGGNLDEVAVPATKADLIPFLNEIERRVAVGIVAAEPEARAQEEEGAEPRAVSEQPARASSYTDTSVSFEDHWESFPLALKLHYAALALEEARTIIKPVKIVSSETFPADQVPAMVTK